MQQRCPECGLTLDLRGPAVEYCPRCLAFRRRPVRVECHAASAARGPLGSSFGARASSFSSAAAVEKMR